MNGIPSAIAAVAYLAFVAALGGCDCGSERFELFVDLRTDFVPGAEFTSVRSVVTAGGPERARADLPVVLGDDYVAGRRVLQAGGLPVGDLTLVVSLIDLGGREVASRTVRIAFDHDTAVTVVITRSCQGVVCPASGAPDTATSCVGARCVDPGCTPENPTACGMPACTTDAECPAPAASCAEARCVVGECFGVATEGGCDAISYCDPLLGCRALPFSDAGARDAGSADAGALDAGAVDAGAPDAGPPDGGGAGPCGVCLTGSCMGTGCVHRVFVWDPLESTCRHASLSIL